MKRLIDTIRQAIAEWLLFRAGLIAPSTDEGEIIVRHARDAFGELSSRSCACPACSDRLHASDCAVHNGPALPAGPCDCATQETTQ